MMKLTQIVGGLQDALIDTYIDAKEVILIEDSRNLPDRCAIQLRQGRILNVVGNAAAVHQRVKKEVENENVI